MLVFLKKTIRPFYRKVKLFYAILIRFLALRKSNFNNVVAMYIVPNADAVNGGILSIFSLVAVTRNLLKKSKGVSYLCVVPCSSYYKNNYFKSSETIFTLSQLLKRSRNSSHIFIHIPEYMVNEEKTIREIFEKVSTMKPVQKITVNILNQNISLMPSVENIKKLKLSFENVTVTTAHHTYATEYYRNKFTLPTHHFSTFLSPSLYAKTQWREKKESLVISPDYSPLKQQFLFQIKKQYPNLEIIVIENLTYEEYKKIISQAKWCITFGEGLDNYFIETLFTGGIAFAVYNNDFFTKDFEDLPNVFNSSEDLFQQFYNAIEIYNQPEKYALLNEENLSILSQYYNYDKYEERLKRYYEGVLDFP